MFLFVLLLLLAPSQGLPAQTFSGVCPAIKFTQSLDGNVISFMPSPPNLKFAFVDVHLSLESAAGLVLKEVSYSMVASRGVYTTTILDASLREVLDHRRPNLVLKYSFTYCVDLHGDDVDCDTEIFTFVQYEWKTRVFGECPTACGLASSVILRDVWCSVIGSTTAVPDNLCVGLQKPVTDKNCPATPACVSFKWVDQALVECSTECGLKAYTINKVQACVGSDGVKYSVEKCKNLPKSGVIQCPATPDCVTWNWEVVKASCPVTCGYAGGTILPEVVCRGSSGRVDDVMCAKLPRPPMVTCPATAACVSYHWETLPVHCPTECGYFGGLIEPGIKCIGTDGREYIDGECNSLPRPAKILCQSTPLCVKYVWEVQKVVCPVDCGYLGGLIIPEIKCKGTDGRQYFGGECKGLALPLPVACPATFPCVKYYWQTVNAACPVICGQKATTIVPDVKCMGTDSREYFGHECDGLKLPLPIECPATAACVDFKWVGVGVVSCPTDCGHKEIVYYAGDVGYPIKCVGTDGKTYPDYKCTNVRKPEAITCPATEVCIGFHWEAGLAECPDECGLPASTIQPPAVCKAVGEGVNRVVVNELCVLEEKPQPISCPATVPCLLPKYCPVIDYTHEVIWTGSQYTVKFTPADSVKKFHLEFLDLHVGAEHMNGGVVPGGELQNYRMIAPPVGSPAFTWTYDLPRSPLTRALQKPDTRMVYWFTYCVGSWPNMVDCDTQKYFFPKLKK